MNIRLLSFFFILILFTSNSVFAVRVTDYVDDWISMNSSHEIQNIYPEYYKYRSEKWKKQGKSPKEELEILFRDYQSNKKNFIQKYKKLQNNLESGLSSFSKTFSDLSPDNEVILLHSLGELNGGTRSVGGKTVFLMGIDIMSKYHTWEDDIPFFHHEFFHLYHMQKKPKNFKRGYLGDFLWKEGLATYISKKMNPLASPAELMLEIPSTLYQECNIKLAAMSKELIVNLKSKNDELYKKYFLLSSKDEFVPKRAGYCVGYLAVKSFGDKYTLKDLAEMDFDVAIKKIKKALNSFIK